MAELVPVYDRDGALILYDMYIPAWIGSRRTIEQCHDEIARALSPTPNQEKPE